MMEIYDTLGIAVKTKENDNMTYMTYILISLSCLVEAISIGHKCAI